MITRQDESVGPASLTIREVLRLPSVRAGGVRLLSGEDALDRPVRWAHVSELADIAGLLRGGELVLTTGIALPPQLGALHRYVNDLAAAGISGLVVELGRRFAQAPKQLVEAARAAGLPLIVLDREVRFVEITEAIHTRIVDSQVRALQRSELIHQRFTALTVDGAPLSTIVELAAELCGRPVVLENVAHQVLAVAGHDAADTELLAAWETRSRSVRAVPDRVEVASGVTWTVVPVAARGERWGRLVAVNRNDDGEAADTARVLERGAAALAVNRLSERDETTVTIRAHQEVLTPLIEGSVRSVDGLDARARALGVPLVGRVLIGVAVAIHDPAASGPQGERLQQGVVERVVGAARGRLTALIDSVEDGHVRLLASLPPDVDPADLLTPFAQTLQDEAETSDRDVRVTVGVGSPVRDLREVRRTLAEADDVVAAAPSTGRRKAYVEMLDVRLRGLMHVLRDDPRLQRFVERELGPLIQRDAERESELLQVLRVYLDEGRNKSRTASAVHLSRPALYARLRTIGAVLDADLDDVETCLSLHVALLGLASLRSGGLPRAQATCVRCLR